MMMAEGASKSSVEAGDLAMVQSDYSSVVPTHLKAEKGDVVTVVSLDGSGYWVWCRDNGQSEGHVPAHILRKIVQPPKGDNKSDESQVIYSTIDAFSDDEEHGYSAPTGQYFKSLYPYKAAGVNDLPVRENDIVRLLNENQKKEVDKKLFVESCSEPGKRGTVPSCFLKPLTPLDLEPWYVGKMNREDAEIILHDPRQPLHCFLVRQSDHTPEYVISLKSQFEEGEVLVRHRKISEMNGRFKAWPGHTFKTVAALVRTHCTSAGDNTLGTPYVRPDYVKLTLSATPSPQRGSATASQRGSGTASQQGSATASPQRGSATASQRGSGTASQQGSATASPQRGSAIASPQRGSATASQQGSATVSPQRGNAIVSPQKGSATASHQRDHVTVSHQRDHVTVSPQKDSANATPQKDSGTAFTQKGSVTVSQQASALSVLYPCSSTGPSRAGTSSGPSRAGTPTGPSRAGTPSGPSRAGTPTGPSRAGTPTGPSRAGTLRVPDPVLARRPLPPPPPQ